LDDVQNNFEQYTAYTKKALKYVRYLIKQQAPIGNPQLFEQILSTWENQHAKIDKLRDSLCEKCSSINRTEEDSKENCIQPIDNK
jgi:hypothetical protein